MDMFRSEGAAMLVQAILALETEEECRAFLEDLMTGKEIQDCGQRLMVARLLSEQMVYSRIAEATGAKQRHHQPGQPLLYLWHWRLPDRAGPPARRREGPVSRHPVWEGSCPMNEASIIRPDERASLLLRELYHRHGYSPYRMSKFEEYDLYVRNKSFLVSDSILTFTDTDGRLMALKPDVTLSIVKNTPDAVGALQKVCYNENVYRTSPAAIGYREIMQTGLECIGDLDLFSMGEVVSLAEESLSLISQDYLLDLSHIGFVSGLLEGVEESARTALLSEIGRKNVPAIHALCAQFGLPCDLAERLGQLAMLYGPPSAVLPRLEALAENAPAQAALEELRQLCQLLETMGRTQRLRLDFSIVNDMSYYNGVIFRGYLPGLASGVLSGGRYDNLLRRMGKRGGAIGFAVYLDQLERLEEDGAAYDADVLLLYGGEDDPAAVMERAAALRAQGLTVRAERDVPPGLRCRTLERMPEGGGT